MIHTVLQSPIYIGFKDSGLFRPPSSPAEFHIDSIYIVPGVGLVVGGIVRGGRVRPGQQLLLGPDKVSGWGTQEMAVCDT